MKVYRIVLVVFAALLFAKAAQAADFAEFALESGQTVSHIASMQLHDANLYRSELVVVLHPDSDEVYPKDDITMRTLPIGTRVRIYRAATVASTSVSVTPVAAQKVSAPLNVARLQDQPQDNFVAVSAMAMVALPVLPAGTSEQSLTIAGSTPLSSNESTSSTSSRLQRPIKFGVPIILVVGFIIFGVIRKSPIPRDHRSDSLPVPDTVMRKPLPTEFILLPKSIPVRPIPNIIDSFPSETSIRR